MRRYKLAFDPWGLLLFVLIMLPNLVWFAVPAPRDILRGQSGTETLDAVASVCQVLLVAALCGVVNRERGPLRMTALLGSCAVCGLLYYLGWVLYYRGIVYPTVILLLTAPPCLCFFFYALDRKNFISIFPITAFTICHLLCSYINFVV